MINADFEGTPEWLYGSFIYCNCNQDRESKLEQDVNGAFFVNASNKTSKYIWIKTQSKIQNLHVESAFYITCNM